MPDSIVKANNITALDGTGVGIPDGTVASPGLKFTNDSDSGLYRIGANDIAIAVNGAKAFEADPNTVSIYTGGVERFRVTSTGQQSSTVPDLSGSNTTLYPGFHCRAWMNYKGNATRSIRGSGNVTSVTVNGTGDFTMNFTTAMPDTNYMVFSTMSYYETSVSSVNVRAIGNTLKTTGSLRFQTVYISATQGSATVEDYESVNIGIFR